MDQGAREFWDGMGQGVFGVVGDAVGLGEAGGGVDVQLGVGVDPVSGVDP